MRQLTTFLVVLAVAFVLVPVGSWAAQVTQVFITDPTNQANRAHVDGSGNLLVRGGVNVNNLPQTQDVDVVAGSVIAEPPVATQFRSESFHATPADPSELAEIEPIEASLITVLSSPGDRVVFSFCFDGPCTWGFGGAAEPIGNLTLPLTQPVPIDSIHFQCQNLAQDDDCGVTITIVGS